MGILTKDLLFGKFASACCRLVRSWICLQLPDALVAQSVEHHHGKVGVNGSNPFEGSFFIPFHWGAEMR